MDALVDTTGVEVLGDQQLRLMFADGGVGDVALDREPWKGVLAQRGGRGLLQAGKSPPGERNHYMGLGHWTSHLSRCTPRHAHRRRCPRLAPNVTLGSTSRRLLAQLAGTQK
jgi:hypothetical protein